MKWGKQQQGGQQGWGYWHGSYSSWQRDKTDGRNQDSKDNKALLTPYDQVKVDGQHAQGTEVSTANDQQWNGQGDHSMIRDLQTCPNQARKAENKVKRLGQERGQRAAQWASYEQEVRAAFLKERRRFQGDIEGIAKEMQQAAEAQEQARAKVRLAAQGSASLERPTSEEPAWDGADPWLELTADADEDPPAEDAALQEVLARAFSGAQGQGLSQGSLEGMVPSTPPSRLLPRTPKAAVPKKGNKAPGTASASTRLIPFPPPKRPKLGPAADEDVNMQTAYASEDPYQRVVGGHGAPADTLASPPLGGPKTPKARSVSIPNPRSASVQDKLNKKRIGEVRMHPPPSNSPAVANTGTVHFQIFDDDQDPGMCSIGAEMD